MEIENLKYYRLPEITYFKVNGRTTECMEPLTLFWTGSGFEVNVKGAELWVDLDADFELHEPWFSVLVNGAYVTRQRLNKERTKICLFRNMNPDEIKNVRFVKDVQAMHEDPGHCLQIHGLLTDGVFEPVEEKKRKIEFIGDSITSGEGTVGSKKETDWISMFFSAVTNYASYTAAAMDAELRIISESGWGVISGWDGNLDWKLPEYYEKVCGILTGEKNRRLGANEDYDFTKWQPDIVVVNLGTNDASAFLQPGFMKTKEDFEEGVRKFLIKLRHFNKKAEIIWCYGMLGHDLTISICKAIDTYQQQSGDYKVHFLPLPQINRETVGSREHPGVKAHEIAAGLLTDYIKREIYGENV